MVIISKTNGLLEEVLDKLNMENKNKKIKKAIIITIIIFLILILSLFLVYKNRDSFGVKTSSVITKIFNPLETSSNIKKETVQAGEDLNSGDAVTDDGTTTNPRTVRKSLSGDSIFGYANSDIPFGQLGDITLDSNSFWNSISGFLGKKFNFKFKAACEDGKDNDGDGLIDEKDPNCHIGGDLNNEYVPKHFSESENPIDPMGIEGIDLVSSVIVPISSPIKTETLLTSRITNSGNQGTGQGFTVLFTISEARDGNSDNNIYLTTIIDSISSKESRNASVKYSFLKVGNYFIRACADKNSSSDEGVITEAFEDNNCGGWTNFTATNTLPDSGNRPECSDEKDNDGDGLIDIEDPSCHLGGDLNKEYLPNYNSESRTSVECSDTIDNDGDGLIDELDPACHYKGDINEKYLPYYNSESQVSYACNDTIDNDGDNLIDELDPNCHEDGDLTKEYRPTHNSESESPEKPNICLLIDQNPITFTEEEKAQLADLTKRFFLVSPSLQSEESISGVYLDILNHSNFVDQLNTLIKECTEQTSSPLYTGPRVKFGNPWYDYNNRGSYLDEKAISDYLNEDPYASQGIKAIEGCTPEKSGTEACQPQISNKFGYCIRDYSKPDPHNKNYSTAQCGQFKTFETCRMYGRGYQTGCTWVYTFPIKEYEALLNVW